MKTENNKFIHIGRIILCLFIITTLGSIASGQNYTKPLVPVFNKIEVNTYNGNLFYPRQDFLIKGIIPLDLSFYYNSVNDTLDYGYGRGWNFHYGMIYSFDSVNNIVIVRNAGRKDTFKPSGSQFLPPTGIYDQLSQYEPQKYKLTTPEGIVYEFGDPSHKKLTRIVDLNGNTLTLTYTAGRLATIVNSSGRSATLTWNGNHLSSLTFSNSTYNYFYENNLLTKVTNAKGDQERYNYNGNGKIDAISDYNGNPVYIEYNGSVLVNKIKSCVSEKSFSFVEDKSYVMSKRSLGMQMTPYQFDDHQRVIQITNPDQQSESFEYDDNNNITKYINRKGDSSLFAYDTRGNLLSISNPIGQHLSATYNSLNRVTSVTDPKGNITSGTYDSKGNLMTMNRPLSVSSSFAYNDKGNIVQLTNPRGGMTTFSWDNNHNLTGINYPIGSEGFLYDNNGNMTRKTDANGHSVFLEYANCTSCGQISRVKINDTIATQYSYDANGNLKTETDANGNVKTLGYNAVNNLTSVTIPAGTANYQYDEENNLSGITDANGHTTHYVYNAANLVESETDAIGKKANYEYDANGNLIKETDANGNTINYTYNALDQMTQRSYPGNTDHFSYDQNGNLLNVYNNDISISYTYDALNRITSKAMDNWNKTIYYSYDKAGNRIKMVDPDGGITNYTYDANNRLVSLTNPFNETTTFQYDAAGRITKQTNSNGTYAEYTYTNWDWLVSLVNKKSTGALISKYQYTYDRYGNRLTMTVNDTSVHRYTYDASHRLTQAVYPWGETESFTYDGAGNRLTRTLNGNVTNYTYNEADQLQSTGAASYTYDNNGNMTSKTENGETTLYSYNAFNRLIKIQYSDGTENNFVYDPDGNRIITSNKSNQITKFLLDGDNVLMELNQTGSTQALYTTAMNVDSWISMHRGSQSYMFHKDGLNSTTALSDNSQMISASYIYSVFGEIKHQTGTIMNSITYTGREFDSDSKNYYYRTRYYDSKLGRFLTKDIFPINLNEPREHNKYIYVENNPLSKIDEYGQNGKDIAIKYSKCILQEIYSLLKGKTPQWLEYAKLGVDITKLLASENRDKTAIGLVGKKIGGTIGRNIGVEFGFIAGEFFFPLGGGVVGALIFGIGGKCLGEDAGTYLSEKLADVTENTAKNMAESSGIFFNTLIIIARDPNEILGPPGYDSTRWVAASQNMRYSVSFENDPDFATAPAQKVLIRIPISENLNMYDFRLSGFGFGSFNFEVPPNKASYTTRLDLRDSLGLFVDVNAGLNVSTHEAFWLFESIDPATGLPPADPQAGFLPVNDSTKEIGPGEGYVTFNIKPKESDQTGDSIPVFASIIFDQNAPIKTNVWNNVVDALPPVSKIDSIFPSSSTNSVTLSFTGQDDPGGCGIASYKLYYSKDTTAYMFYGEFKSDTTIIFTGSEGSIYKFFSIATDHVGNIEPMKSVPDVVTTMTSTGQMASVKVFTEGPYDVPAGNMKTLLNSGGYLPHNQPYSGSPWNYNGNEYVVTFPAGVVDWLLIELRDAASPQTATSATKLPGWPKALFLKNDGTIVDLTGHTPNIGNVTVTNNLYVVVRHRNHVAIMSSAGMTRNGNEYSYDFTTGIGKAFGGIAGYKQIGASPPVFGMVAADIDADGSIFISDLNLWIIGFGQSNGYYSADTDLDGNVYVSDFNKWGTNFGTPGNGFGMTTGPKYSTQVPK